MEFPATFGGSGGVVINNSNGVNLGGSVAITNGLTLTSGTFSVGANTLTLNGPAIAGTPTNLSTTSSSSLIFGGSSTGISIPSSVTTLNNSTINNSNGVSLSGAETVSGTLTLTSGAFSVGANTLTLNGPAISGTPTNLSTTSSSSLIFGGSSTGISIPSSVTALNNLTINNSNGVTLSGSPTVNGTLTLTNGLLTTNSNTVTIGVSGSISGAGSGRYVNGNLARVVPSSGSPTVGFDIGDASNYTPASLVFNTLSSGGTITAKSTAGEHPSISSSGINQTKDVNRYWTLTNTTAAFANYSAAFNFINPGDVDAGANTSNFIVKKFNSPNWSSPTTGTRTSTSTQATGMTSFSDFAIGEAAISTFTLTVNATNGTVTKNPDQASYDSASVVQLTATPATGYHFTSWSGDLTGSTNPATVIMDRNNTITANFAINTYTLTTNATNGSITKNPDQASYDSATVVQLTAIPATGYHFTNWSGDLTSSTNPATVTMDRNKTITANFAINTYTLTVNATNGTVTKNPDQASYDSATVVQLSATPATGYHFTSWSGDLTGSTNPATVMMDRNKTITANFAINTYTLTINATNGTCNKESESSIL